MFLTQNKIWFIIINLVSFIINTASLIWNVPFALIVIISVICVTYNVYFVINYFSKKIEKLNNKLTCMECDIMKLKIDTASQYSMNV